MRKGIFEFRISDVNYHIRNKVSVYFAKFCSHIKKKKMRKGIFEFRISDVNIYVRNKVSVYFAKFCSHIKKKKKCGKKFSKFAYLM